MADATLRFDTRIDSSGFDKGVKGIASSATSAFGVFSKVAVAALGAVSGAFSAAAAFGIKYNMDMENSLAALTTMFQGSQEKAIAKMEELRQKAAVTPFELPDLLGATQIMMSYGLAAEKVSGYLDMLGDVSLGNRDRLQGLAIVFSQVQSTGKLMGQDLLQMINQGFNPLNEISKMTGKSMAQLKDDMAKGAISADMVTQALKRATSEGGIFYKGLENASKTAAGQISTLKDNVKSMIGEITKGLSTGLTIDVIPMANKAVEDLQKAFREKGIPGLTQALGDIFANLVTKAASYAPQAAAMAVQFIKSMAKGLYDNRGTIAKAAADIGEAILSAIFGRDIRGYWNIFIADISAALGTFASVVGAVLKPVGAAIEVTFKFLLSNSTVIVSTITAIGAAFAAFKSITVIQAAITGVMTTMRAAAAVSQLLAAGASTATIASLGLSKATVSLGTAMAGNAGATTLATRAIQAFTAAWASNPIGMVAVGIGVAAGAIALLAIHYSKANAETKALIESSSKLNDSVRQSKEAFDGQAEAAQTNVTIANNLLKNIEELSNVESRSVEEKKQLANYVAQLNAIYPDLNLQYSIERDALNMTNSELKDQITNRQAIINMKATEARQIEIAQELLNLEKENTKIEDQLQISMGGKKRNFDAFIQSIKDGATPLGNFTMLQIDLIGQLSKNSVQEKNLAAENVNLAKSYVVVDEEAKIYGNTGGGLLDLHQKLTKSLSANNEKVRSLASDLDSAAKRYGDFANAQDVSAESMAGMLAEYNDLVAANGSLLAQYPELYAAMDKNNTVQQNSKAIAEAVWKIKKQLLIQELEQQASTIAANIKNLEAQRDAAVVTYSAIAQSATFAWDIGAQGAAAALKGSIIDTDKAIADAKAQADSIKAIIENIGKQAMPTVTVSAGGGSGAAKAIKTDYEKAKEAIDKYRDTAEYTKEAELTMWQELQVKYKNDADKRLEIDKNVRNLEAGIRKDNYSSFQADLDEQLHRKQINTKQSIVLMEAEIQKYGKDMDEYKALDRLLYDARQTLAKEDYDAFRADLDERKYYNQLSKEDELALLNEKRKEYAADSEYRKQLDRDVYALSMELEQGKYDKAKANIKSIQDAMNEQSKNEIVIQGETSAEKIDIISEEYLDRIAWVKDESGVIDEAVQRQMSDEFERSRERLENLRAEKAELIDNLALTNKGLYDELQGIQAERDAIAARQQAERDAEKEQGFTDKRNDIYNKMAVASAEDMVGLQEQLTALDKDEADWRRELADREALNALSQKEKDIRAEITDNINKAKDAAAEVNTETQNTVNLLSQLLETGNAGGISIPVSIKWLDDDLKRLSQLGLEGIGVDTGKMQETGKAIDESVGTGITGNLDMLIEPAAGIIDKTIQTMRDNLSQIKPFVRDMFSETQTRVDEKPWYSIGYNIMLGIAGGINDGKLEVVNAIIQAIREAIAAGQDEAQISSPSKKTIKDGLNLMLGYNVGLEKGKPSLISTLKSIIGSAISAGKDLFATATNEPSYQGIPLSVLSRSYAGINTVRPAGAAAGYNSTSTVNHYHYEIYPQKMTYTDMPTFAGEISRMIVKYT